MQNGLVTIGYDSGFSDPWLLGLDSLTVAWVTWTYVTYSIKHIIKRDL